MVKIAKYHKRIIVSGDVIEVYEYQNGVYDGYTENRPGRSVEADEEGKILNRAKSTNRSKNNFRREVNANAGQYKHKDKFVTLTLAEEIPLQEAYRVLSKYHKRLEYRVYGKNAGELRYHSPRVWRKKGKVALPCNLLRIATDAQPCIKQNLVAWLGKDKKH